MGDLMRYTMVCLSRRTAHGTSTLMNNFWAGQWSCGSTGVTRVTDPERRGRAMSHTGVALTGLLRGPRKGSRRQITDGTADLAASHLGPVIVSDPTTLRDPSRHENLTACGDTQSGRDGFSNGFRVISGLGSVFSHLPACEDLMLVGALERPVYISR